MSYGFLDIAITPSVRSMQEAMGSDRLYTNFSGDRAFDRFTDNEVDFIAQQNSFYMSTVSESGWPYVQHRGGAPGFLKVIDERTLAFGDFRGNRQYISAGNARANPRACLILVDYPRRARLKIYARVEIESLDDTPELADQVVTPDYRSRLERIFVLHLEAFDWNCSQHITARYTEQQIAEATQLLQQRLAALEAELADLRG